MTILRTRKVWRRPPIPDPRRDFGRLTPDEQANVLRAMAVLRSRLGTWLAVAKALRVNKRTMNRARSGRRRVTPAFALRVARLLGEPLGKVLTATWPQAGAWAASDKRCCQKAP